MKLNLVLTLDIDDNATASTVVATRDAMVSEIQRVLVLPATEGIKLIDAKLRWNRSE